MSESSSDTESSCGWTVISNEGSDIETLGPDNAGECEDGAVSLPSDVPDATQVEDGLGETSLDLTLRAEATSEPVREADAGAEEHVILCSSSDNSDIITLGDAREAETEEEPVAKETEEAGSEDLGSSSSSQYTFRESEKVFPVDPPVQGDDSNSSTDDNDDDDDEMKASPVLRRRRVRRSSESGDPQEKHRKAEEVVEEIAAHPDPHAAQHDLGPVSSSLNKCILLALLIAISMGFGHFYGTVQIQERQRIVEKSRVNELDVPLKRELDVKNKDVLERLREDLEEKQDMVLSLSSVMDKITKENQHLRVKQEELQAQRRDLFEQLLQTKSQMESGQKGLTTENQKLKISLEREEASLSALQEELLVLRGQIRELEDRGAGAQSIQSENRRLKGHLQEEKQKLRIFMSQREALMAEAQLLRKELEKERKTTENLKEELNRKEETGELQAKLEELENKLKFEQQRSDLWERLYLEMKEERAKGDRDVKKTKIPKDGMLGKVKETFDAMKNSTKEFVHHQKEQIKKAKEAVKENLRKFSDSVKSTLRNFKNSASNVFSHEKRFQEQQTFQQEHGNKRADDWQPQKPLYSRKSTADSPFNAERNTRKPGAQKTPPKGCSGVYDCAYQESMSLFNKAMEPIRADEFNELLRSYLQKEVGHFHHWRELESFINNFFHNGVFIHDQMLFTDFVSSVEDYLEEIIEYHGLSDDVFEDLDDYIYRHIFGDTYLKYFGPSRPLEGPGSKVKAWRPCQRPQRKQQHQPRPHRAKKWSQHSGRDPNRQFADVKIELGPMPFDPKY
ncbi:cell cycle progression protein 1 isoform X2 [Danio aesculapii]|uniref:cell cycle progression protein 1 isoform X2 n=1 Tax=Danio aesculapii TaxID=1142201 RepID=UPI0024C05B29|nr:cell cycle progression protein 1 isoform X2 [Danio aesculapii]